MSETSSRPRNLPPEPIAHRIRVHLDQNRPLTSDADFAEVSKEWKVPESQIRSTVEFFPGLSGIPPASCGGIPCTLTRGEPAPDGPRIACAGKCYRTPVDLNEFGHVVDGQPALPPIRCLAKDSILSGPLTGAADPADYATRKTEGNPEKMQEVLQNISPELAKRIAAMAEQPAPQRFIVAHTSPGNPGIFTGPALIGLNLPAIIEGMVICGIVAGNAEGVFYIPAEDRSLVSAVESAVAQADEEMGSVNRFPMTVVEGFGAFVAGEETAILNAIEGRHGEVRIRPPEPGEAGLFGAPTLVESVETFHCISEVIRAERGTISNRLISVTSGFPRPGLVEVDHTVTVGDVIEDAGGNGMAAVLMGGPLGSVLFPEKWDLPFEPESFRSRRLSPGHWGLTPIPEGSDFSQLVTRLLEFGAEENCGKCVPCRLGPAAAREMFLSNGRIQGTRFKEILSVMEQASLCKFGRKIPGPIRQIIERLP